MKQWRVLSQLVKERVVAVIRGETPEQAEAAAAACYRGGIRNLEVTFTVPEAERVIGNLRRRFPEALIGAGTVLDAETARGFLRGESSSGGDPGPDVPSLSSALSPRMHDRERDGGGVGMGFSILKLFPGNAFGPAFLKSLKGPLPQAEFIPTGGVNLNNVTDWLQSGGGGRDRGRTDPPG
ncbi:2-dehydro-3-deoxyphosphogluconate aldolase/(4S)-4-hydroxy-2-oxoglutarate aldolase [Melghirimyces profundicolus]|uniref:2-dehydro-3-deoxyphosphogluconate aldolase/(4S)-4-hydroxy-2-oxoglutarate aldolase n=1 Tax=Melghirimyces profundicolus TaxID=1242148 RepID=A0A2T6C0S3_9BACL|nr:bifunctional 2-keto-4-hydroxyglutarate aldolase/2-keto-3-deoxy-6-phosphogluconate aldolase [Melghirimyces profundicolus]PTX61837.1 2-dehydro-3-deoxyphosphogluconate aldolase/(4S)-4-hydroxy-2-oxoglutarate aldolase [Melghirimyces profundicolus]